VAETKKRGHPGASHEIEVDQLIQGLQRVGLGHVRHGGGNTRVERFPGHGGGLKHGVTPLGKHGQLPGYRGGNGHRDRSVARLQAVSPTRHAPGLGPRELLQVEGVSSTLAIKPLFGRAVQLRAEQQLAFLGTQRPELKGVAGASV